MKNFRTAFWNRLIPATERAAKEEEPAELGIRAARLKTYDEVGPRLPCNTLGAPFPPEQVLRGTQPALASILHTYPLSA